VSQQAPSDSPSSSDGAGADGGGNGGNGQDGGGNGQDGGGNGQDGGGNAGASNAIATTGEVPEGGGVILDDDGVVLTQPSAGQFRGFSNICTHQGCAVASVDGGTINCGCHGSMFSIEDGSVVGGPAPSPLPEKPIVVAGKDISLA
jgi:Rieske Fe-S protein